MENYPVRQVRVEPSVVDLADNGRDLGNPDRRGQFVIEAARDFDLEAPIGTLDDFQGVPPGRAGLVDLLLLIAEIGERAFLGDGLVREIPLRHSSRENGDPHDLEGLRLAESLLEVDVGQEREGRAINQLAREARLEPLLEATDR